MSGDLRLGLMLGYWAAQPRLDDVELAQQAESFGFDSVWTAESWGSDVVSPLAWIGAQTSRIKLGTGVMQLSARTPASAAMTALTLDHLSGGRMILGLGVSGPQVVEGWYGQPFPQPLARTREYVRIIRAILAREHRVTNDGPHYPLPYPGGTGLGKPLRSITHPRRPDVPIVLGAEGPKNVALAAEIADGWLPIFTSPDHLAGLAETSLKDRPDRFRIYAPILCNVGDLDEARLPTRWMLAFYIGGMGAESVNFHKNLLGRMGFADESEKVQELFLAGDKQGAVDAITDEMCDAVALCGPEGRIREHLQRWIDSPATDLLLMGRDPAVMRLLADALA